MIVVCLCVCERDFFCSCFSFRYASEHLPVVAVAVDVPLRICRLRLKLPLVACQGQLQMVYQITDLRQLPRDHDPNKLIRKFIEFLKIVLHLFGYYEISDWWNICRLIHLNRVYCEKDLWRIFRLWHFELYTVYRSLQ